jgi:hypothetical protein
MKFNPIYAAYGSNLNHQQMAVRCPNAEFIGIGRLPNYRLIFRSVADIEYETSAETLIGLWKITPKCLEALDRYEGYPNLYDRSEVKVWASSSPAIKNSPFVNATIYWMRFDDERYQPPSIAYYQSIEQGYKDCGMPLSHLKMQLERATNLYYNQEANESELRANGIFNQGEKNGTFN